MSLKEGGKLSDILLLRILCSHTVSLVNFISREPEEFLAARVKIIRNARANFGLVNIVEKEYAGKKVQWTCQKFVMIVGSI
jgi:hypothetical protein